MDADGDLQAVEGVLTKVMATISEYLQTGKLKLSTTKMVLAAVHLNKEAKRELNTLRAGIRYIRTLISA